MSVSLQRPTPVLSTDAPSIGNSPVPAVVERLIAGETCVVTTSYGRGADVLDALAERLLSPDAPYAERNAAAVRFREVAQRLLVPIEDHAVGLPNVEYIGFLRELYPELTRFYLPLVEVQSLHGSWRSYQAGVHLAVLGHRLHPFHGTYVPTRTVHLELFATWLAQYAGARGNAVDVGTGSGVLAFLLARAGFERVVATDLNPNAVHSVLLDRDRQPEPPPIEGRVGDLLEPVSERADLIVFNPPWTQGDPTSLVDQALVYPEGLFERFFDQALGALADDGRVVLVFSNLISLVQPDVPHPIESELARGRYRLVQRMRRKVPPSVDADGRKRRTKERVEVWELARA